MPLLITWKPDGWPVSNIHRLLEAMEADGVAVEPWRVLAHRHARVGDRVWLLRQGKGTRGIFGVGEVADLPSMQMHEGEMRMMVPVRFSQLVDPTRQMLISLPKLQGVLPDTAINSQSSGVRITEEQSAALERLLSAEDPTGSDWTPAEVSALVDDYFDMLKEEIEGRGYNKTEHRRALMAKVLRSHGAIERKHQNVSAVLHRLGLPWIEGYKPLGNFQTALAQEVARHLRKPERERLDAIVRKPPEGTEQPGAVFVDPPSQGGTPPSDAAILLSVARKFDVAKRDARNRELGRCGEEFVVAVERARLRDLGLHRQADDVQWVARDQGDGLGYDVTSFDEDGSPIFIEVKTTRGTIDAPFYVTERERAVAAIKGESFRLYRVFQFGKEPRVYVLRGPLEGALDLRPTAYRATVLSRSPIPSSVFEKE